MSKRAKEIVEQKRSTKRRTYKNFDADSFLKQLSLFKEKGDFSKVLKTSDLEVAVHEFTKVYNEILDYHAPVKVIQHHKNYLPYMTSEIKDQISYRNKLKKLWISSRDPDILSEYKDL